MHLVDRSVLEDLLKSEDDVVENDKHEKDNLLLYDEFLDEYDLEAEKSKREFRKKSKSIIENIYSNIKANWLKKHCPPIKYIDEGSSRAAYACSGGKCLKIAINSKGIAQNKQEIKNVGFGQESKYSCFTMNFAYDKKHYGSLLTECCAKLTKADLQKTYGFKYGMSQLSKTLYVLKDTKFNIKQAIAEQSGLLQSIKDQVAKGHGDYEIYDVEKLQQIIAVLVMTYQKGQTEPRWKILSDLIKFYQQHHKNDNVLLIDDLENIENWGLAIRGKQLVPIIIDAGFSEKVYQKHYVFD